MSDLLSTLYDNENITYYKIYTDKCIYTTMIKANSTTNSFYLHLGGTIKGCVILFIDDYKHSDTAILDTINYDSKCNITEDLEEGEGTKHMIFTALNILMYYFPNLKYVKLLDTSHKNCSKVNKVGATPSMNLATYFMLFHKQTWYEKLFGAQPIQLADRETYKKFIEKLDLIQINKPFELFIKSYFKENDYKYIVELNKKYNLELDKLYKGSKTYSIFFHAIKDKINDKTEICNLFSIFLYRFMADISNDDTSKLLASYWLFPTTNIIKIHFKEERIKSLPIVGGDYFLNLL